MSDDAAIDAPARAARKRGGGRAGNNRRSGGPAIRQSGWETIVNSDHPTTPLRPEGVEAVHDAAMRVLEEIGIDFLNEEAKTILKEAGCDVDPGSDRVRMGRDFVMEMTAKAPSEFTLTPRNPERASAPPPCGSCRSSKPGGTSPFAARGWTSWNVSDSRRSPSASPTQRRRRHCRPTMAIRSIAC